MSSGMPSPVRAEMKTSVGARGHAALERARIERVDLVADGDHGRARRRVEPGGFLERGRIRLGRLDEVGDRRRRRRAR